MYSCMLPNPSLWTLSQVLASDPAKMRDDVMHDRCAMPLDHSLQIGTGTLLRACNVGRRN